MTPPDPVLHAVEAPTARTDALHFLRRYRPESFTLLDAQTEGAAADRFLALRVLPYGEQDPDAHEARRERFNEAEKEQSIPGLRASLAVSTALFLLVMAGAGAFLVVAWAAFGSAKDLPLLAPERFGVPPALELLLLAPTALVPLYLLFILSVHWRARAHGRAVLRIAQEEGVALRSGIPVRSPLHGLWSSWAFLGACLKWALCGYVVVAVLAWWNDVQGVVPVVIAYAIPVALILVPVHLRTTVWKRRDELLDAQLYRDKHEARSREGLVLDEPLEEIDEVEEVDDAEHVEQASPSEGRGETQWRTHFPSSDPHSR